MKQKKTINERTPVAGDVWWVNKTTGAQDMYLIVQAFEKVAIALKLNDKQPYSDGVQVVVNIIRCGVDLPHDAQEVTRLRAELVRLEKEQEAKNTTADAVIDALRKKAADLETKLKEAPVTVTPASPMNVSEREQATLNYGLAKREAQIYKQLYSDLIDKVIAMAKADTEPDGIPF